MSRPPAVPAGAVLSLDIGEWRAPTGERGHEPIVVKVVAVDRETSAGLVATHGHDCNPHRPDCGRDHCWEGHVLVSAIRAEVEAAR